MNRSRGSAMLLVLVLVIAITSVVVATAELTFSALRTNSNRVRAAMAEYAFEGAAEKAITEYYDGTITPPITKTITVGDIDVTITVTDNSVNLSKSLLIEGTIPVMSDTFEKSRVVGARMTPSPFYYALAVDADVNLDQRLLTGIGGKDGDVYVNGDLTWVDPSTRLQGDLDATGSVIPGGIDVEGTTWEGAPPIAFPSIDSLDYETAADYIYSGGTVIDGRIFSPTYALIFIDGNATISGGFSGKGTIFVRGNLTVSNDMTYLSLGSRMAIIVEGSIRISSFALNIVGYFYTGGDFRTEGIVSKSLVTGGIVASSLTLAGWLTIIHDPEIWTDPSEANKLKLPGFWP